VSIFKYKKSAYSCFSFYAKNEDAASALELKKTLIAYDRSLLVADPRRMEPKKFGGRGARARRQKVRFGLAVLTWNTNGSRTDKRLPRLSFWSVGLWSARYDRTRRDVYHDPIALLEIAGRMLFEDRFCCVVKGWSSVRSVEVSRVILKRAFCGDEVSEYPRIPKDQNQLHSPLCIIAFP
jgi:hypothetical protein